MGLFDRFQKPKTSALSKPGAAVVQFDDDRVTCRRPNGVTEQIRWSELRAVLIQTTADGPAVDDLFWVLIGRDGGCVVPSEAHGYDQLRERLQQLPGFDYESAIRACSCIEEQIFVCWERPMDQTG
jgi:hypothetical protein